MTKAIKEQKPQEVEIWTRNLIDYYEQLERHILNGYTVLLDGFRDPTNIHGILTTTLVLKP